MMSAQQQANQQTRMLQQQAQQNARQQAAAQKQAAQLAAQQAKYAQQLALKSTPAKRESTGFNLDSLGSPDAIDALAQQYDQVQVKNGNQSLLLQRAVNGQTVTPMADVNQAGNSQVVPDSGPKFQAYQAEQAAAQPRASSVSPLLLIGGGAVVLIGAMLLLRKR